MLAEFPRLIQRDDIQPANMKSKAQKT